MRIALVNSSRRMIGGAEAHIEGMLAALQRSGEAVAFWTEIDEPQSRRPLVVPDGSPAWCAAELGAEAALAALRAWRPDVIYTHIPPSVEVERELLQTAPAVFFAHGYFGTCVSGAKTHKRPRVVPCSRAFGWQCLVHYYPRRCGGLNPLTMLASYRREGQRREHLFGYRAVVTHSRHMREEYLREGLPPETVFAVPFWVPGTERTDAGADSLTHQVEGGAAGGAVGEGPLNLLFMGRMEPLKGGNLLIEALPGIAASLNRPLRVVFAGDGRARVEWERAAARTTGPGKPAIEVEFVGWAPRPALEALLAGTQLLVVPSVWPEPFGMVGPEAGLHGVPSVAFDVGGIREWLHDGVNGHLAPGDPPTAGGLMEAAVRALENPGHHSQLRIGARRIGSGFTMDAHLQALLPILQQVAGERSTITARSR